ncbi:hypothetical protein O3P69_013159 [Scylla paramamosain]|uniref:Uncharacterized protein n=1 Tax=Scylla paramamosain TaxID=85552 RepID=A0AAW0TYT1_SCYPA
MLILLHTFWYLQHVTLLPFISSGACIPDILGWIGMLQAPVLLSPSAAAGRGSTWLDKYIRVASCQKNRGVSEMAEILKNIPMQRFT